MSASDRPDADSALLAAAGALASGVAAQLNAPLREIRDSLAVMVETLDQHIAHASGPQPYPWVETKALRERIAEAYLLSRAVTRLTSDLARAVSLHRLPPQTADVDKLVEQAIALARHRIGEDSELSIDLGDVPPVRIVPGELVLLLARLLTSAADAARGVTGGGIAIAIRRERDAGGAPGRDTVLIQIGAVAGGATAAAEAEAAELEALARRVLEPAGGALAIGGNAHFEIRLVVAR
jgi:C4-dicarboxylate-specific signal transduction histidine kinase